MCIKYISFLWKGGRKKIPSVSGRFTVKAYVTKGSKTSLKTEKYSAFQFVSLDEIRSNDPVLNLEDGSKLRVYLGGDPTYMIVESASKIEKHDKKYEKKKSSFANSNYEDQPMVWDDYLGHDDF